MSMLLTRCCQQSRMLALLNIVTCSVRPKFSMRRQPCAFSPLPVLKLGIRIHADQLACSGAAEVDAEAGATTTDHVEQMDARGIEALAKAGI
jgi:imidazolonepropionase-like amidohydrolase